MKSLTVVTMPLMILIVGCYSETSLTKDETVGDNVTAYFHLRDGTHVKSVPGRHARVDGGYQVSGEIYLPDESAGKSGEAMAHHAFEGRIPDANIQETTKEEFDWLMTTVAVALPVAVLVYPSCNLKAIGPVFYGRR